MANKEAMENKGTEQSAKQRKPGKIALWALLILVCVAGFLWLLLRQRGNYTEMVVDKSFPVPASGQAQVQSFAGGLLRYSGDGISFSDNEGREQWNISCSMKDPQLIIQKEYGALADLTGQTVVVFDKKGESGRYKTTDPIIAAAVSAGGVTVVALERDLNSLICFYDKAGLKLDIEISLEMAVSGYPMAMALSPDGSGLVLSMISSQGGAMNSQLVFYNFSVGRSEANRLVGYFNHENHLLTQIDYLSSKRVVAVTDAGVEFYSLEQENKPTLKESIYFPGDITGYMAGNQHVAFLYPDPATGDMRLAVYNEDGVQNFAVTVGGGIRRLILGTDLVLLQTESRLEIWNYKGDSFYSAEADHTGAQPFLFGKRLILLEGGQILHMKFK